MKKRIIAIITSTLLAMSAASASVYAADSSRTAIYNSDFAGLNISRAATTDQSFSENNGTFGAGFNDDNQKTYINNPDGLTSNDDTVSGSSKPYAGTGTLSKVEDDKYGTTLVFSKSEKFYRNGFGLNIRPTFDKNKNIVIKTAIKRDKIEDSDVYITMLGYGSGASSATSEYGFDMVKFMRNGDIYVNASKNNNTYVDGSNILAGKYETGVWYELVIEYSASNKFAMVTIDGGMYDNTVIYCSKMSGNQAERVSISMMNMQANTTHASDMHIAYIDVYYTAAKTVDNIAVNTALDFENYKEGTLKSNAAGTTAAKNNLTCGVRHHIGTAQENDTVIEKLDSSHGKSLKIADNGLSWNQLRFPLDAPYAKPFTTGKNIFEFEIYGGSTMLANIFISHSESVDGKTYFNYPLTFDDAFGNNNGTVIKNKWLKVICTFDMESKECTMLVYDIENPSDKYQVGPIDISSHGNITQVAVYAGGGNANDGGPTYIDNIMVYNEPADFSIIKSTPVSGEIDAPFLNNIVLNFSHEIASGSDGIRLLGGNIADTDYTAELLPCKRTIIIKPFFPLDTLTDYKVNISGLTDTGGNVMNLTGAVEFKTADYITITPAQFTSTSGRKLTSIEKGNITATVDVRVNDGETYPFLIIYALYNKSDNALCAMEYIVSSVQPSAPVALTVTVPETGEYYAEVSVLDTINGLKPYTDKFRLE